MLLLARSLMHDQCFLLYEGLIRFSCTTVCETGQYIYIINIIVLVYTSNRLTTIQNILQKTYNNFSYLENGFGLSVDGRLAESWVICLSQCWVLVRTAIFFRVKRVSIVPTVKNMVLYTCIHSKKTVCHSVMCQTVGMTQLCVSYDDNDTLLNYKIYGML